ncbi:MAG TPA: type II secretion system protein [Phycisphaerales bacterium]|nr:type II secretion system protein [Phycisphaerales bacterium]
MMMQRKTHDVSCGVFRWDDRPGRHPRLNSLRWDDRPGRHPRAFTLIELVIVIGIIAILASLTVAITSSLMTRSDIDRTQNTLTLLDQALVNWEQSAKRTITIGMQGDPYPNSIYDIDENAPNYIAGADSTHLLRRVLYMISRTNTASDILTKVDSKFIRKIPTAQVVDGEVDYDIIDAWDNPIRVLFPGAPDTNAITANSGNPPQNPDGTIKTQSEIKYGYCVGAKICFFSAGPDGKLGDLHLGDNPLPNTPQVQADINAAADNIYSYPLSRDRS